jgi:hypothetical protein
VLRLLVLLVLYFGKVAEPFMVREDLLSKCWALFTSALPLYQQVCRSAGRWLGVCLSVCPPPSRLFPGVHICDAKEADLLKGGGAWKAVTGVETCHWCAALSKHQLTCGTDPKQKTLPKCAKHAVLFISEILGPFPRCVLS